jgi:tRNA threonylcarbamoyladenosine biosynthesis protein TsaB
LIVLGIDTALEACSAAVLADGRILAARTEPMSRGHQERLAPLVAEVMAEAGLAFSAVDRVGVTIGPGSFTGLRVGLAFAKGLCLSLAVPCVGVGALEAVARTAEARAPDAMALTAAVIDARRGQVYLQVFAREALGPPETLDHEAAVARLEALSHGRALRLAGSGAYHVADRLAKAQVVAVEAPDPSVVARLAAEAPIPAESPSLVYLRAPDARLPA